MEGFSIYNTLKCIGKCAVHRDQQHVKNEMSVQFTKASIERLIYTQPHTST